MSERAPAAHGHSSPALALPAHLRALLAGALLAGALMWLALVPAGSLAAAPGAVTEFEIPLSGAPSGIADGPEGNLWFTEYGFGFGEKIERLTPSGQFTQYPIPGGESSARSIAAGPDGNLWFTEYAANAIGRITPAGKIAVFQLPTPEAGPNGIASGPDGNLWFTETALDRIGRITPSGEITEFSIPTAGAGPVGIAQGPDGDMWFTEYRFGTGNQIGRITTSGQVTEFTLPAVSTGSSTLVPAPYDIASGPDANLWFTDNAGDAIGRITVTGEVSTFRIPTERARPYAIAAAPDGAMWFTEYGEGAGQKIGRIETDGAITEYPIPTAESGPAGITAGADGNLWFSEYTKGKIGQIGTDVPPALQVSALVSGDREATVPQHCTAGIFSSWNAQQPLDGLYGFDGFHWSLEGVAIRGGGGETFTPTLAQVGHKLTCTEVVSYPQPQLVSDASTSPAVSVIAPPPIITGVHESQTRWSEGRKRYRGKKPPEGTIITFHLNEPVPLHLAFNTSVTGRRVEGVCVAQTRGNRRHRACPRTATVGALAPKGQLGPNRIYFQGVISQTRSRTTYLNPGHYTLVISAANTTGSARPVSLHFTLLE